MLYEVFGKHLIRSPVHPGTCKITLIVQIGITLKLPTLPTLKVSLDIKRSKHEVFAKLTPPPPRPSAHPAAEASPKLWWSDPDFSSLDLFEIIIHREEIKSKFHLNFGFQYLFVTQMFVMVIVSWWCLTAVHRPPCLPISLTDWLCITISWKKSLD